MAWADFGNGPGVYRSSASIATTVPFGAIPDILEDLRVGVNERIAIGANTAAPIPGSNWLSLIAPFGDSLSFAQAQAAVASLRAWIEGLATTSLAGGSLRAWNDIATNGFWTDISSLLLAGSYGNSWLDFNYLQDGRIYEQMREAIDNIHATGSAYRITAWTAWQETEGLLSIPPTIWNWEIRNFNGVWSSTFHNYSDLANMWGTIPGDPHYRLIVSEDIDGTPAIYLPMSGRIGIPSKWVGTLRISAFAGAYVPIPRAFNVTIAGEEYLGPDVLGYVEESTYYDICADVAFSEAGDATLSTYSNLMTPIPLPVQSDSQGVRAYFENALWAVDDGSTWTKKP